MPTVGLPGDRYKHKSDMVPTLKKLFIYLGFILFVHEPNIRIKESYKFCPVTYHMNLNWMFV